MPIVNFFADRELLHNEVHARPYEQLSAPARISHLASLCSEDEQRRMTEHLGQLMREHHLPVPAADSSYLSADFGRFRLRWERHTEFYSLTIVRPGGTESIAQSFVDTALASVSSDWLDALPGEILVALHVTVAPRGAALPGADALAPYLDVSTLVGSHLGADDVATLYTDFQIHADRFGRMLLLTQPIGTRRLGRTVQRLLEIETYRMLALLALPKARQVGAALSEAERALVGVTGRVQTATRAEEPALLDQLTLLAGQTEALYATNHARFSAASAYYDLVQQRIAELNETAMPGLQTVDEFMQRRLAPAMQTCLWTTRRQQALSERVARASDLLRTRVNIEQDQQNQALLSAMNRRQLLQIRLQQTVEGLSVAAITYYASGLVGYMAKGLKNLGVHLDVEIVTALSIPIIALLVWRGLRLMHKRLAIDAEPES
jgi:uncharacterized membrane-anchored protein